MAFLPSIRGLLDLIYPPACLGCGTLLELPEDFCTPCSWTVELLGDRPQCPLCGEPLLQSERRCARCIGSPPPLSRAASAFLHQGAIAQAIHRFKYGDHPELAPGLTRLLVRGAESFLRGAPYLLCPIPLHSRRFLKRAYDQAGLLGACLAQQTGRSIDHRALRRVRQTRPQVGLAEGAREQNVKDAFSADSRRVQGRRLLLIDDVFTTGATARSAARELLDAGAAEVQVLTLARAGS